MEGVADRVKAGCDRNLELSYQFKDRQIIQFWDGESFIAKVWGNYDSRVFHKLLDKVYKPMWSWISKNIWSKMHYETPVSFHTAWYESHYQVRFYRPT